jgi:hypothetical protein
VPQCTWAAEPDTYPLALPSPEAISKSIFAVEGLPDSKFQRVRAQ